MLSLQIHVYYLIMTIYLIVCTLESCSGKVSL